MPLSEEEQRVLDEIERQLQIGEPIPAEPRVRRVAQPWVARLKVARGGPSSNVFAVLAVVGGLATVIVGVLLGGASGIVAALVGFGAIVAGGVNLLRSSRESLAAQIQEIADRYQGPVR